MVPDCRVAIGTPTWKTLEHIWRTIRCFMLFHVVSQCFTMFHISSWRMGIRGFYRGECGDIAGAYANCKSNISDRNHHIEQPLSLSQQPQPKPHETT